MGPVFGVNKEVISPMNDIHVPTHGTHLKVQDCWIIAIVWYDELQAKAIGGPSETHVDCLAAGVSLAQVWMKSHLIATSSPATKS